MNGRQRPVARLDDVTHRYGATCALDAITLDIPSGCTVGLIGPDGVGKSSLLGIIAGARRIQTGRVRVLDGDMANSRHRNAACSRIAYMPQGLGKNLYPDLSVRENIEFFGRLFGQSRDEREWRIAELLESTGLAPFPDRPAKKLSGGMRQKLGLCCALIHDPDLLILDEPTTGVDPLSRRQFWDLIDRMRARRPGMSVIIATAYMEEAERFDWLIAMDAGRVLATGSPAELKAHTKAATIEEAFLALLPEPRKAGRREFTIPPRRPDDHEAVITARDLTCRFGDFTAVDRVSFTIERGEIFGFLGPNGCGKTTTMKMLTGLLPATAGEAFLLGKPIDAADLNSRNRVGYMSQSFSLYTELTARQNLELHARLFHLPREKAKSRIAELARRFGLDPYLDQRAASLPLGIRQRLSLAVAIVHEPEMLILDEPTSGVDPLARDQFWELLIDLSRNQNVTIFVSTHFMNEAARCDRISLMHDGRVLATGEPAAVTKARGVATLEEAFIAYLEEASGAQAPRTGRAHRRCRRNRPWPGFDPGRTAREEPRCLQPAPDVRLHHARNARAAARPDPAVVRAARHRLPHADLRVRHHHRCRQPVVRGPRSRSDAREPRLSRRAQRLALFHREAAASPTTPISTGACAAATSRPRSRSRPASAATSRRAPRPRSAPGSMARCRSAPRRSAATCRACISTTSPTPRSAPTGAIGSSPAAIIETRFRYNQDFKSVYAMVPSTMAMLLVLIPAILMALAIVREKELGSIINLYVTPVTRIEFLLGKQLPYIAVALVNFAVLFLMALFVFDVPLKGSFPTLALGAVLYVTTTTGYGMLISSFTRTQIAALFGTAILTIVPATQFSGMLTPVSSLSGAGAVIGHVFPMTLLPEDQRRHLHQGARASTTSAPVWSHWRCSFPC